MPGATAVLTEETVPIPYVTDEETQAGVGEMLLHIILFELVAAENDQPGRGAFSEERFHAFLAEGASSSSDQDATFSKAGVHLHHTMNVSLAILTS